MNISQKDDYKTCTFCDRTGHIYRHCRQRTEALEKRAMAELVQQTNETERMEEGEPGHREMQEDQPPNSQPQTPASDTCTTTSPLPQLQLTPSTTTSTPTPQLVPTQVLHTLTPYSSTQEITFVSGGNLATATSPSYKTPTQQNQHNTDNMVFYATDPEQVYQSVTYDELVKDEQKLHLDHLMKLGAETQIWMIQDPVRKAEIIEQAWAEARKDMHELYETLWDQFITERERRKRQSDGT